MADLPKPAAPAPKPFTRVYDQGTDDSIAIREYYRDKSLREAKAKGAMERARHNLAPGKRRATRLPSR